MTVCVCEMTDWEAKERQAEAEKEEAEFNRKREAEVREMRQNHISGCLHFDQICRQIQVNLLSQWSLKLSAGKVFLLLQKPWSAHSFYIHFEIKLPSSKEDIL